VLLLVLVARARAIEPFVLAAFATGRRAAAVAVVAVLLAVPHVMYTIDPHRLHDMTFVHRGVCPVPDSLVTHPRYYACVRAQLWSHPSPLREAWQLLGSARGRSALFFYAGLIGALCALAHATARRSREDAARGVDGL
jgi:hypothetical protein